MNEEFFQKISKGLDIKQITENAKIYIQLGKIFHADIISEKFVHEDVTFWWMLTYNEKKNLLKKE